MKKLFLLVLLSTAFFCSHAGAKAVASEQATEVMTISDLSPGVDKIAFWDCTVKVNVKITFADGSTVQITGEVTVKDVSCAELLKQLLAAK